MHRMCGPSHGTWAARKLTPGADDAGGALSCPRPLGGERMFAEEVRMGLLNSLATGNCTAAKESRGAVFYKQVVMSDCSPSTVTNRKGLFMSRNIQSFAWGLPALLVCLLFLLGAMAQAQNGHPVLITQNVDENKLITLAGNTRPEANAKIRSRPGAGQLSHGAPDAPVEAFSGAGARTASGSSTNLRTHLRRISTNG